MTIEELRQQADVPLVIANGDGFITEVNSPFEAVFGWTAEEAVGMLLTAIIPAVFHDAHNLGFSRFLATGTPTLLDQAIDLEAVTRDGREFAAEHYIVAERVADSWTFAATIRPLDDGGGAPE